jgi:hypothetical protein
MTGMNFMESLRKGLDRAGFEADKLMRYNRVRAEGARLHAQASEKTRSLGEKALELYRAGALAPAELTDLARETADLQDQARLKEDEATAIQNEAWVEPPDSLNPAPPPPAAPPAPATPTFTPAAAPSYMAPPRLEDQGTRRVPVPDRVEYCPNCGGPLRPNAAFCSQCGFRL